MNKENALTRKKLKQIDSVEDFDRMLNNLMASEEDKKLCRDIKIGKNKQNNYMRNYGNSVQIMV